MMDDKAWARILSESISRESQACLALQQAVERIAELQQSVNELRCELALERKNNG